jgi:peptidoglycan/xylan/chitin deacetylase (PgdA/CDA1 family)
VGASTAGLILVVIAVVLAIGGGGEMSPPVTIQAESAPLPPATPVTLPPGPMAPVISRIPTSNRVMFLTIDDGLVQDPAVVDYLRRARVPLTMFILPRYVSQNPPYFRSIQALGASIQDHTVNHRPLNVMSFGRQVAEICGALDPLTTTFGQRPWLFRPPYGSYNADTKRAVRACGLQAIVTWQGTMNDGVLRLQHPGPLQPGDIVLLHFRPDLRQNLAALLAAAHAAGLRPAPLEPYLPLP